MNPFTQSTLACSTLSDWRSNSAQGAKRECPAERISTHPEVREHSIIVSKKQRLAARSLKNWRPIWLLGPLGLAMALAASGAALAVDVNIASLEQLQSVRGIGPKTAQTILAERSRGGPFDSFEDLSDRVKGIGAKKAAALQVSGLKIGAQIAEKPKIELGQAKQARTVR